MKKENLYVKKKDCTDQCLTCRVYNKAQREIGKNKIIDPIQVLLTGLAWQERNCPDGKNMDAVLLHPANLSKRNKRYNIRW